MTSKKTLFVKNFLRHYEMEFLERIYLEVFIGGFTIALIGIIVNLVKRHSEQKARHLEIHESAKLYLRQDKPLEALVLLCQAGGNRSTHETIHLIANCLELLGRPDLASESYRDARRLAFNAAKDLVPYYYYRESWAYIDSKNWEFAYARAKAGIEYLNAHRHGLNLEPPHVESELRVLRMMSALRHLTGNEALRVAKQDALWVMENSPDTRQRALAKAVAGAVSAKEAFELELTGFEPYQMN